jgi:lipid A 3-O-deacylase
MRHLSFGDWLTAGLFAALISAGAAAADPTTGPDQGTALGSNSVPARQVNEPLIVLPGLTQSSMLASRQLAQSTSPSNTTSSPNTGDPSFITVGGGWFDFNDDRQAAEFRLDWRGRKLLWIFKPLAGIMATTDQAIYGYAGFLTDFYFGRRIVLTPSFAAGLYEDGDGKDLGSVIEFRSGLELGWRFDNRSRLSAMVYHISNASIDDNNPGTEVFSVGYSFPLQ